MTKLTQRITSLAAFSLLALPGALAAEPAVPAVSVHAVGGAAATGMTGEQSAGVFGRVVGDLQPLSAVRVYAYQLADLSLKRVVTDADGSFRFPELPAGLYKIIAHKSGFVPAVGDAGPQPDEHAPVPGARARRAVVGRRPRRRLLVGARPDSGRRAARDRHPEPRAAPRRLAVRPRRPRRRRPRRHRHRDDDRRRPAPQHQPGGALRRPGRRRGHDGRHAGGPLRRLLAAGSFGGRQPERRGRSGRRRPGPAPGARGEGRRFPAHALDAQPAARRRLGER